MKVFINVEERVIIVDEGDKWVATVEMAGGKVRVPVAEGVHPDGWVYMSPGDAELFVARINAHLQGKVDS
jgi:hypothetical protein